MCPMCETKNHSLKYICPLPREAKKWERANRGYENNEHPEQVPLISERAGNVQANLIIGLPTPIHNETNPTDLQDVCIDSKSLWGRDMHRM